MSKHALLSPSGAHRWLNCTPSARLEAGLPETTSAYAEEGRLAHSVCELMAQKKFTPMGPRKFTAALNALKADPAWNDEMLAAADGYVERLSALVMEFEHAPYTALEVKVDVSEYVPEAFGTCDCVMIGGRRLCITDFKYGKGVPVSAYENSQLMLYALGALNRYRPLFGEAIEEVIIYIDQPRLSSYECYDTTVRELLEWGNATVKPKAAAAYAGEGEYAAGEWCRFCRAKAQCRARADSMTALEDFKGIVPALLSPEYIGSLLTRGKALAEWYESLKDYALSVSLNGGTIPGWKAVEGRGSRTWVDQDKALEAIIKYGCPREVVYDRVPKSLPQLEKLIGKPKFNEIVGGLVTKTPGKPAIVPESDSRPAYGRAEADFKDVESA